MMTEDSKISKYAAYAGILAALLVGTGEFLLHYDAEARFTGYDFMKDISHSRLTMGHFFAMAGLPFYFIGLWHLYLQLRPGGQKLAFATFAIGSLGFLFGAVWMGSRATIGSIVHYPELVADTNLVELYELRCETLLQVTRITTMVLSGLYIYLVLKGKTHYPRWMAWFSPILLLVLNFVLFAVVPSVGKYTMPIALNVAFFIFFSMSAFLSQKTSNTP